MGEQDHPALAGGFGRLGRQHRLGTRCGGGDEGRDVATFRHVAPILLRHVAAHQARVEAGRVEDRGVIGPPVLIQRVLGRHLGALPAGAEGEGGTIPDGGAVGGDDDPAHAGEAAGEEGSTGLEHMVLGLEPGDVARACAGPDLLEAQEGLHLVRGPAHGAHHALRAGDVGIGSEVEQVALAMHEPPEQAIEQSPAPGVGVQRNLLRQEQEAQRHAQLGRLGAGRRRYLEQAGLLVADPPGDGVRRHARGGEAAGGFPPAVEVGGVGEADVRHGRAGG